MLRKIKNDDLSKISLVTGAGNENAIGFGLATKLLKEGHIVNVLDYMPNDHMKAIFNKAAQEDSSIDLSKLIIHSVDITDAARVQKVLESIQKQCTDHDGIFSHAINCAGLARFNGVHNEKQMQLMEDVNLGGALNIVEGAGEVMQNQAVAEGDNPFQRIIMNFGTATAFMSENAQANLQGLGLIQTYMDTKKRAAKEIEEISERLAGSNIQIGEYCPGHVADTGMFSSFMETAREAGRKKGKTEEMNGIKKYITEKVINFLTDVDTPFSNDTLAVAMYGAPYHESLKDRFIKQHIPYLLKKYVVGQQDIDVRMSADEIATEVDRIIDQGFDLDENGIPKPVIHDKGLVEKVNAYFPDVA